MLLVSYVAILSSYMTVCMKLSLKLALHYQHMDKNIDKLFYKTNIDSTSSIFLIFQNAETVEKLNETGDLRQLLRPYKVPIICMFFD